MTFDLKGKRVFVAGHRGMVGSAVARRLAGEDCEILTVARSELDLLDQAGVRRWMAEHRPDAVVMAAAKVGGILANDTLPVDFLHENLVVQTNVMESAFRCEVRKLLFLGSSCIYPKLAPQPIPEDALLTGPLEPTNEWYAVAKIAGLKLCQAYRRQYGVDYISAMPTNLYGPGDNFDLTSSHVVPALMRKAHEVKRAGGKQLEVWGSGRPMREFLHVDDAADALVWLLKNYSGDGHVNVGSGEDISIGKLARTILSVVGVEATVTFDATKPDGTPRKLLDVSRLFATGWRPRCSLRDGLEQTYGWFLRHVETGDVRLGAG
ncbi:MAG: NAD-dependent epimerase/dehydratase family protein [Mesorhizobium sp.]|uniref:GDP-L-fucose synthase n=2 Tax=Mesorhizobium TaxID=68287 RepID=UPI000F75E479|nr:MULTISPECIES: GDP-L-fucose synthase [unclassified Mesorhizobium]AZO51093.1 GDP-L-fucose synthase [Mesorhizobium sp. M4B.F.Ca.ET.058.02.1.1]RUX52204.1 NAD-dependent epimerase/dehydratase family protein [Mesorhizobium sp. M4A.F.Ca.ET.050.02.1.1]RVC41340.1 NAD-dependent epimerase/dehydratase family protein [Mesorhizobium sp. M4A.F.Ca.ET.090.04.2.1]RVD34238.1 NAD-dependent epimerase/dehydratase family protein [Mesorhizobium sp. M4A.F.Ca.ET.020.02.1.1]RWC19008.1 MAG: NAD-dependent epimerase/dehy